MRHGRLLRLTLPTLVICLLSISASSRELTLEQVLKLAVDHAHSLKQVDAERRAADESLGAARRDRLPVLSATALASYVDYVPKLEIDIPGLASLAREFGSNETYQADIRLSLPVYTGSRISGSIDAAAATADYYTALAKASEDKIILQARVSYLVTMRNQRLLGAAEASLERATVMHNDVKAAYAAGIADTVDLLESELAVTLAESRVTAARIALRRAEIGLSTLLGLSVDEPVALTDTLPSPPENASLPPSLIDKPEIAAARAGVGLRMARMSLESADYFPSVFVYGGYSYGKPNLDRFNNTWNDYLTVGAQLTWSFNVGNKTGKKRRAANFQLEAARRQLSETEERLTESARLSAEEVKLAQTSLLSARKEHRIAAENYRLAQLSHREGALASNRMLEIEAALSAAESSLAAARVEYFIAYSSYLYAIGSDELGKGL